MNPIWPRRWVQMLGWEWLKPRPIARRRLQFRRAAVVTDLRCLLCEEPYPRFTHVTVCHVCGGTVVGRFELMRWLPLEPIGMPR